MLISHPADQKRIRETILRAALIAKGDIMPAPILPPAPAKLQKSGRGKPVHTPEPAKAIIPQEKEDTGQATIQAVTFMGHNPDSLPEWEQFRDRIATYYYGESAKETSRLLATEEQNTPSVMWENYIVPAKVPPCGTLRDMGVGYFLLEGTPEELGTYLSDITKKFNPMGEERTIYPVSVVGVPIPFGDPAKTTGCPGPRALGEMVGKLTEPYGRQVAVCISGPATEVQRYASALLENQIWKVRTTTRLANITIREGYVTTKWADPSAAKSLHISKRNLKSNAKALERAWQFAFDKTEEYIQAQIAREKRSNNTAQEVDQTEWTKLQDLIGRFEENFREVRRSASGGSGKEEGVAAEERADRKLNTLARNAWKRSIGIEAAPTEEEIKSSIQTLTLQYQEVLEVYKACWEEIQTKPEPCETHAWSTIILLVRNRSGFKSTHAGEAAVRTVDRWEDKDAAKLLEHGKENRAAETHLATTRFLAGDMSGKEYQVYPKGKAEKILNPAKFPLVPAGLIPDGRIPSERPKKPQISLDIRLQPRADIWTETELEIDNRQIEIYNPVAGKPTGFKDAALWRPCITRRGLAETEAALAQLGYDLVSKPETFNYVERKTRKAERCLAPNYALTPYEALAYFENGARPAAATVIHPETNETLWVEGKSYHITPSWKRQTMMVDHSIEDSEAPVQTPTEAKEAEETRAAMADIAIVGKDSNAESIQNAARIQTLTERRINFGYATFLVEAEGGKIYEIRETVSRDTIAMEKERIAAEIEHSQEQLEKLQKKEEPTKQDKDELRKLEARIAEKTIELDSWAPMLEDFLAAFPPEAPAMASEVYNEQIDHAAKRIFGRFGQFVKTAESGEESSLKDYQLKWAAIGAVKRGHLNGGTAGSGKSIMSIMASWHMGHHYNWVICPTIAMRTWAAELERVGLYHELVGYKKSENGEWSPRTGVYEHARELRARFHRRERKTNRLGRIEPEYYVISAEAVCLGGEGNKTFSPWHYNHPILAGKVKVLFEAVKEGKLTIPPHWELLGGVSGEGKAHIKVWSDRGDSAREISKYSFEEWIRPVRFSRAVKECPRCEATAPTWTHHGHCNRCGHHHSGVSREPAKIPAGRKRLKCQWANLTNGPLPVEGWTGEKTSNKQYPLYKLMGKHVGCKIIDEIHNWTNFHSQHGAALLQVRCKDAIVLSGTLCKTHIAELEPSLCQVYEANSGEFPYSPWGMDLFKEQFQTIEIESTYRTATDDNGMRVRRRTTEKVVPEASNLTKLRALLHGVMCSVGENEMERVWNLKPISETIRYVELQPGNAAIYAEWERLLQEAYAECKTEVERVGMLRRARSQLTHLAYACDGPEKLEAAVAWVEENTAAGHRSVIVGPSTRFYTMLTKTLKARGIPFVSMGNTPPEKRFEILNKFRDGKCPNFVSRIRLVNVNFNQLTCCTRILFTGIDPSPAAIRQMQKRLNRIGQKENVHCTFLISQRPPRQTVGRDILETLAAIEEGPIPETEPESESLMERPPSYEERLFALVLRRETAIKQTLQQADRQRDPQELYEMLKDRQTLNQLLEDIVKNTRTDPEVTKMMREMAEPVRDIKPATAVEVAPVVESEPAIAAGTRTPETTTPERGSETEGAPEVTRTAATSTPPQRRGNAGRRTRGIKAPDGYKFTWSPVKKQRPNILQGHLFSL